MNFSLSPKSLLALALLIAAAGLGNYYHLPLFFGVDFLFGTIFVFIILHFYNLLWATLAALLAATYTYFLWGHPYAIFIWTVEVVFVGWLMGRYYYNLILSVGLYWLLLGGALIVLFYGLVMQVPFNSVFLIGLKQGVNSIFNAIIASLIINLFPLDKWLGRSKIYRHNSYHNILFIFLMSFLFFPALFLTIFEGKQEILTTEKMIKNELIATTQYVTKNINYWYSQQNQNLIALAQEVQISNYQITSDYLDNWLKHYPDFTEVYFTNKQGNIIGSSSPNTKPLYSPLWKGEKITPVHYDSQKQSYSLGLLTPILQEGQNQGVIHASVKLATLNQLLQNSLSQNYMQLILLNNQGQVLADSSLKYKPLEKINLEERGETRSLGNNLMQWIPLKKGNTPIILRWQRSFYMSQVQLGEDLPWQILVKISANPYIQELEKSYIRNLTIMLFISLFGLGMSQLISRRLTAPLLELSQVTTDLPRKIAKDIPVRLNAPSHIFELNQLAENFQLMITTLQSQFSKLKQAKSTLEQRVLERTEDLLSFTENLSQEIKQRELTELSLRESEERYALAVAGTNDGIWDWNVKTNQVYYSPTWLRIVGYEDEPIETRLETWLEKIHPEDKYKCLEELQKHLEGQTAMFEHSQRLYHKQGHYIWVAIKGKCMRDSQGNPSYIAGTLTDVTLQQQAQEQLIIAKQLAELANKSKNEFIANISHEIRTPMTTILGFCDLLQDAVHDPHAQSYIKAIAASGQTLLSIINDILDLSKIEAGKLAIIYEPLDLAAVISEVSHFFTQQARQKNLDIFIHLESSVPAIIKFDEIRLRQILFNVLGNALKFTEKGWIKITAQAEHRAEEANYVQLILSITDTGIGIPVEQQEQIFEAFAQREGQNNRKYGGAGLGLTITRRLTSMLGGEVYLKSEINQGSTFSFHFPRVEVAHISNYLPTESVEKVDLNKYYPAKILIAEDNLSHQDLLREYFANSHHQLIFATDGESAFSLAISEDVDLVLMDLKMPKMGGVETLKKFKQHPELWNIPMIILTAWLRAEEREYLENICQGIILKPFSKSQLTSALKAILHPLYSCSETTLLPIFSKIYSQKSTDLIRELEVLETTIWSEICQTMIMANIRQCAYQLEGLFQTYQATELCIYTDKLLEYLNSYDIEKFTAILKEFPQIKKFLEH